MSQIDVDAICKLSCLNITDERKKEFTEQIEQVLDYMSILNKVDVVPHSDYEWPIHKDVLVRDDDPKSFQHPLVKENAPEYKEGGFSVPKIL